MTELGVLGVAIGLMFLSLFVGYGLGSYKDD